jgi:quercetin dioxygenase-like cupin family protein
MVICLTQTLDVEQDSESLTCHLLENSRVRVMEVAFQPGERAPMHSHPDHVIIVRNGGRLEIKSAEKTDLLDLKDGEAFFLNAQSHEVQNVGDSTVDLYVIELKQ